MFVFSATARSAKDNPDHPAGEKHALLVFVVADDLELARERVEPRLKALAWEDVSIEKEGHANEASLEGKEKTIVDAFYTAREKGFAAVIYTDPLE